MFRLNGLKNRFGKTSIKRDHGRDGGGIGLEREFLPIGVLSVSRALRTGCCSLMSWIC